MSAVAFSMNATTLPVATRQTPPHSRQASALRAAWTALTGAAGFVVGLVPHVLHHVAPVLGAALVAGAGGTLLFGAVGLAATIPMLVRLRRRFGSWWAPSIALTAFAGAFLFSTFVLGPSIGGAAEAPTPANAPFDSADHEAHH